MGTVVVLSEPLATDLQVYRGDTGKFKVTVTTEADAPLDVTSATWRCDIRKESGAVMTSLTITPVAGQAEAIEVSIDATQSQALTESGVWDLEMTLADDVITLLAGSVRVTQDVSR
jgi:hypothetical protein